MPGSFDHSTTRGTRQLVCRHGLKTRTSLSLQVFLLTAMSNLGQPGPAQGIQAKRIACSCSRCVGACLISTYPEFVKSGCRAEDLRPRRTQSPLIEEA